MNMTHQVTEGEPRPQLSLSHNQNPATGGWTIDLNVNNFRFAKDLVDGAHVPGTGHGHLYLNGLKLGRVYGTSVELGPVPKGNHVARVTLNTNDHLAYVVDDRPVSATVMIRSTLAD